MCGIVGVCLGSPDLCAAPDLLEAAAHLQHRGQDVCGVLTGSIDSRVTYLKRPGLVSEVFGQDPHKVSGLRATMALATIEIPTSSYVVSFS